jgi:hypothetical protein
MNTATVIFTEDSMLIRRDLTVKRVIATPGGEARMQELSEGHNYAYAILRDNLEAILIKSDKNDIHGFVAFVNMIDKCKTPEVVGELINKIYRRTDFPSIKVFDTATIMQSKDPNSRYVYWVILHV